MGHWTKICTFSFILNENIFKKVKYLPFRHIISTFSAYKYISLIFLGFFFLFPCFYLTKLGREYLFFYGEKLGDDSKKSWSSLVLVLILISSIDFDVGYDFIVSSFLKLILCNLVNGWSKNFGLIDCIRFLVRLLKYVEVWLFWIFNLSSNWHAMKNFTNLFVRLGCCRSLNLEKFLML